MRNKGIIITLTIVVATLCLYYLSFTYVSRKVQRDAVAYATNQSGYVNHIKKQMYLDSVWNQPVYNFFGAEFTYKEVKENELNLGLDLQGGMHVTLEISPSGIVNSLSDNNQDPLFVEALRQAKEMQRESRSDYISLFYQAFQEHNIENKSLALFFVSTANKGRIRLSDDDDAVIDFLREEIESAVSRSFTILKTRVDQFGTAQPNIQRLQSTGRIQIEIPGADNPQRVRKLLQSVAHLEFWEVVEYSDPKLNQALLAVNDMLIQEKLLEVISDSSLTHVLGDDSAISAVPDSSISKNTLEEQLSQGNDSTQKGLDSLTNSTLSPIFALSDPSYPFLYNVKDTATINKILKRSEVKALFPRIKYLWSVKPNPNITPDKDDLQLYFVKIGRGQKPLLTGEVINDARLDYDNYARPAVSMTMNVTGSRTWAKITAAAASKSPPGRIAIVLDNYVYTAPTVEGEIPNGSSQITGSFDLEEAKDLANVLKAGSLPAPTRIVEEAIIGPTLGKVAQRQGLISMICGLAIVALFMIAYYSKGGWVANVALLFNIFFILGILAQLNAALTLPGIAGIVLTMGMAVDANVLVYERIKEELYAGKVLKEAVKRGYRRAFNTIFDSNATTLLTAILLFVFGQGPLRGFAIVLIIGIATSFFSTIYISRVIVEWMTRKGNNAKVSFDSIFARKVRQRKYFNFMSYRRIAYVFSGITILIGFLLIAFQGLNLGVDFKGGRSYVVAFYDQVVATDMKLALTNGFEDASTEVKNYGGNNVVKITTSYLIDDESNVADDKVRNVLIDGLEKMTGLTFAEQDTGVDDSHFSILSSSKVGPSIADDIQNSAYKTGIFSLIAIFFYILIRFKKWQFSTGAIVATAHDALFVVAIFGIIGALGVSFEIDQVFVAALLTVIGYSINDTVIIFDRIREYIGIGSSSDKFKMFNDAINSTLSRTIITSGTTLVVVAILLVFGGEVLRGFSFALLIGVLVGTFSSIFIAASIVYDLDKKVIKDKP